MRPRAHARTYGPMNTHPALPACAAALSLLFSATVSAGEPSAVPAARASGALVGGALPGGAVISARSVVLSPIGSGVSTAVPVAADGSFKAVALPPGRYRLRLVSSTVARQTQSATFGEKVNAGLHAAGGALAQGTRSGVNNINQGMPNRISMNVTVARQTRQAEVDGDGHDITVGDDGIAAGVIAGIVVAK